MSEERDLERAAQRGEPSYIWRAGQERRMAMILAAVGPRAAGCVLDDGCGVGQYLSRLRERASAAYGLEFDPEHARTAGGWLPNVVRGAGEALPFPDGSFDLVLSHEVLEHVADDRTAVVEIARVLHRPAAGVPGGRVVLFVPNRGYPFETHGIYWRGRYRFGNIPLVNYLPRRLRDRLAPHVRAYTRRDLERLFHGLPLRVVSRAQIFGAYDNLIARWPAAGRALRGTLQALEHTPLQRLGLSHFWVLERE
jgi:SAM-dependent methyltransferase